MSAFIVSEKHIQALVTFLIHEKLGYVDRNGQFIRLWEKSPNEIGQLLWDENYRSVNYLYKTSETPYGYRHDTVNLSTLEVFKLAESFSYQSCDAPEYFTSDVERIIFRILYTAAKKLIDTRWDKEYAKADWSI